MSDSDSENITNTMERDSAPPPEKRIKFQVNQNAGRSEMSPSCAFAVYPDSQFTDSSQRTIEEKQDLIIKMLEDQANNQIFSNENNSLIDYNPMADLYPIESLDDLNKIEEQIILDSEYRRKIVHDLSNSIGGKNVNSPVKKIMGQLFDDRLLAQFSFAGRKLTSKNHFSRWAFIK
eukprot:XP_016661971.1 PREDICTED: uncharacterized protein LOC107884437 [Acyrthosiphon pisum]